MCFLCLKIPGTSRVMTNSVLVSHDGVDLTNCGNWSMPCRTVRHAVKISKDGDKIYIDYAQARPYKECENVTQAKCSIELTKSVSFHGMNGKALIQCKKSCELFKIWSLTFNKTKIKFFNLVMSASSIVADLGVGARTQLAFDNVLIRNNIYGIRGKYATDCSILVTNSTFEDNSNWGIDLRCSNLSVNINSSIFMLSSVVFTNDGSIPTLTERMEILIQNTVFNYQSTPRYNDMIAIKPYAATLNVTIIDSQIKNQNAMYRYDDKFSALHIYDYRAHVRYVTYLFLSNLVIENNNNWATFSLNLVHFNYTEVNVTIRDSIFRNNSAALRIWVRALRCHKCKYSAARVPTTLIENSTFVDNIYTQYKPNGAAAIYFQIGRSRVLSCRFVDNSVGENPYTGVVTISEKARVTFFNSHFENRQEKVKSTQLFALGNQPLYFLGNNTFNLVALSGDQSVFTRIPTGTNAGLTIKKNFRISCPQGYQMNFHRQCKVIKTGILCYYINVRCEQCPTKTYTLKRGKVIFNKSNHIQCQQCPRGGDCERGLVKAKPNFWGYPTKASVVFLQCPPGYCCETQDCPSSDSCRGNRIGTLCGQCPEGMSESLFSAQCISNEDCTLNYSFIFCTVALLLLYLIFFLYHKEIVHFLLTSLFHKHLPFSSSSGIITIFFYYYQVCNLLSSAVDSPQEGHYIHYLQNVITRLMNVVLVNLPSLHCPLKNLRAVPKAAVLHSVGFCLLGLLCIVYLVSKLFIIFTKIKSHTCNPWSRTDLQCLTTTMSNRARIKSTFSQRVASAFTYISLLMYASSARLCLALLQCVPFGDSHVLFLDGNIRCYQTFQYILLLYIISSVLPFCLVPVLGSYLLKSDRISVKQFCAACIFPLPFCCFWMYLLLKDPCLDNQTSHNANHIAGNHEEGNAQTQSLCSEDITFPRSVNDQTTSERSKSAILNVLLGPFRPHKSLFCFPSSNIPWEGFLIFRRLVLIITLTFVYDIQLRMLLALTLCVGILFFHMFVNPFRKNRDNLLESFSLSMHVILCGLYLLKSVYYGQDVSSMVISLPVLNVIENILIISPLSIVMIIFVFSLVIKLAFGLKHCASVSLRYLKRLIRFPM